MRYICLLSQLDLVAWVLVIQWNLLCYIAFSSSHESASVLVNAIRGATEFKVTAYLAQLAKVRHEDSGRREGRVQSLLTSVLECMPSPVCRTIRRAIDFQTSGWLTVVLPLKYHHFDLPL